MSPSLKRWKVGARASRMFATVRDPKYSYSVGYVVTPHGVVGVYREAGKTMASFVAAGREWKATWDVSFTDARLITECKRFAALHTDHEGGDGR